jgi:putative molybdopterin biosynthesis protein
LGKVLVHGIAIRPGHPVILGMMDVEGPDGKRRRVPVTGLPGYPVSAAMTCELVVKPLVDRWLGQAPGERPVITANLTRKVVSPDGEEEFLRVTVGQVGERMVATPLPGGAGVLMSLVRADGIVRIPRGEQGHEAGAPVTVELLRSAEAVRDTVVAIGSHDLTLDVLADLLGSRYPGRRLSSANVGSLGGVAGPSRGEAHLARHSHAGRGDGEYNLSPHPRLMPRVRSWCSVSSNEQGLIVARQSKSSGSG